MNRGSLGEDHLAGGTVAVAARNPGAVEVVRSFAAEEAGHSHGVEEAVRSRGAEGAVRSHCTAAVEDSLDHILEEEHRKVARMVEAEVVHILRVVEDDDHSRRRLQHRCTQLQGNHHRNRGALHRGSHLPKTLSLICRDGELEVIPAGIQTRKRGETGCAVTGCSV